VINERPRFDRKENERVIGDRKAWLGQWEHNCLPSRFVSRFRTQRATILATSALENNPEAGEHL